MKKGLLIAGALVAFTFASCKKDYTCECTSTCGSATSTTSSTIHAKKKDAEAACTASAASSGTCTYSCALK